MIKISLEELQSSDLCDVVFRPEWAELHHPLIGHHASMADRSGMEVRLQCPPEVVGVWLLRHAWSGVVEIACNGISETVDLWQEKQDLAFVAPLPTRLDCDGEIALRVANPPGRDLQRSQVWLLGLVFDKLPRPRSRITTISSSTRLIAGDWGRFLVLSTDVAIPTVVLNEGAWAPRDIETFKRFVSKGDVVLDVGANFGHHSIVFARLVGPQGLVIAIEAQKVMYQLLNANCVINGVSNVRALHLAASDHRHSVNLYPISYSSELNFGSLGINPNPERYSEGRDGESVRAVCLDDIVEEICPGRRIAFIKIDVQSYEKFVLRGLLRTITQHRPVVFLEISPFWMKRAGYDYREIYYLLQELNYTLEHSRTLPMADDGIPAVSVDTDIEWDVVAVSAANGSQ
jgi:FkbM family methyltransferase